MVDATVRMIAAAALLWSCAAVSAAQPSDAGAIVSTTVEQGIHRHQLRLALPGSGVALFYDRSNQLLMFEPTGAHAGAPVGAAALSTLLDAFFASHEPKPRYQFSGASDGLASRLASDLLRDPHWNAKLGRAVRGSDRDTLLRVMNTAVPFADIADVWRRHGYVLRAVAVENIFIGRRGELSHDPGGNETARVPVSMIIQYEAIREDSK